jgi:hypothetical protein
VSPQPVTPRFASEEIEEPVFASTVRREYVEVPVCSQPAFDEPTDHEPVYHQASNIIATAATEGFEISEQSESVAVAVAEPMPEHEVLVEQDHRQNEENLDIPAFLRRGGL